MWFVQMADPAVRYFNISVRPTASPVIDLAKLAAFTRLPRRDTAKTHPLSATTESPSRPCTRIFAPG